MLPPSGLCKTQMVFSCCYNTQIWCNLIFSWITCMSVIIRSKTGFQNEQSNNNARQKMYFYFILFECFSVCVLQVGMFKIHPEIPESLSLEAKSFILRCFEPDPHKRATATDLLRDTFVKQTTKGKKSKIAFKPSGLDTDGDWS